MGQPMRQQKERVIGKKKEGLQENRFTPRCNQGLPGFCMFLSLSFLLKEISSETSSVL